MDHNGSHVSDTLKTGSHVIYILLRGAVVTLNELTSWTNLFLCQWVPDSASLVTSIPEATSRSMSFRDSLPVVSVVARMAAREEPGISDKHQGQAIVHHKITQFVYIVLCLMFSSPQKL